MLEDLMLLVLEVEDNLDLVILENILVLKVLLVLDNVDQSYQDNISELLV